MTPRQGQDHDRTWFIAGLRRLMCPWEQLHQELAVYRKTLRRGRTRQGLHVLAYF
jgi:hypothetical protein